MTLSLSVKVVIRIGISLSEICFMFIIMYSRCLIAAVDVHGLLEDDGCVAAASLRRYNSLRSGVLPPLVFLRRVQSQKQLISDLRDQRKEIRAAIEINGKCNTKTRSEKSYSRWLKLQLNK